MRFCLGLVLTGSQTRMSEELGMELKYPLLPRRWNPDGWLGAVKSPYETHCGFLDRASTAEMDRQGGRTGQTEVGEQEAGGEGTVPWLGRLPCQSLWAVLVPQAPCQAPSASLNAW